MSKRNMLPSKSKDQLLASNSDSDSSQHNEKMHENIIVDSQELETTVDIHLKKNDDGNFILNKFLQDSMQLQENVPTDVRKAPVPLPRKHKPKLSSKSSSSNRTYDTENKIEATNKIIDSQTNDSDDCDIVIPKQNVAANDTPKDSISSKIEEDIAESLKEKEVGNKQSRNSKSGIVMAIKVHKTDHLNINSELIIHPIVKVNVVCAETGEYLSRSDSGNSQEFQFVSPVMTHPYNLQERRSMIPKWEEVLLINEDIDYIMNSKKKAMLIFELLDFVPFSVAKEQFKKEGQSSGWHKIAWAFLLLHHHSGGNSDTQNSTVIERKIRLQLYKAPRKRLFSSALKFSGEDSSAHSNKCRVYSWWKRKENAHKYPSSLYVTVFGVKVKECNVSNDARFVSKDAACDEKKSGTENRALNLLKKPKPAMRSFKIPNGTLAELNSDAEGCFYLTFNNSGTKLVCSTAGNDRFSLVGFDVSDPHNVKEIFRNAAHQGLIHFVSWSGDDTLLLSASSDCTVCLWKFANSGNSETFTLIQMLPHPSFVYCSIFNNNSRTVNAAAAGAETEANEALLIATGSYDRVIRIWQQKGAQPEEMFDAAEELEGHAGFVTSLCFNSDGSALFSGDSVGVVVEWTCAPGGGGGGDGVWTLKRKLQLRELDGIVINHLALHPRKQQRRLLVHSRDSVLRIVDVSAGCTVQWLRGLLNHRIQAFSAFSPCGNFVFGGGDDSKICVWNADTGNSAAILEPYAKYGQNLSANCVACHPRDHILAVSQYGKRFPVVLMGYT